MRTWGALVALYGVDIVATQKADHATEAGVALALAGLLLMVRPAYAWLVSAVALVALIGPASSTQTAFVMWVSAALWLFDGRDRATALRWVAVTAYGFAAANKALFDPFRSGEVLERYTDLPAPQAVAVAAIVTELALAVLIWRRWRWAPFAVLAFHLPVAVLVGADLRHFLSLVVYGAMMCWVVSRSLDEPDTDEADVVAEGVGTVTTDPANPDRKLLAR